VQGRDHAADAGALMAITVSLTEDQILTGLRAFLLAVLPDGIEVVQGQDNRVSMPAGANFVIMTPARREQLSQTAHTYDAQAETKEVGRSTGLHFTLDVYGPDGSDNTQVITTLFRDEYGFVFLAPYGLAPLYCDDGQQMPLVTGEEQWLQRWMMRGVLQTNLGVTVPQEFADQLTAHLIEADMLPSL
jgi:hypothetical protein